MKLSILFVSAVMNFATQPAWAQLKLRGDVRSGKIGKRHLQHQQQSISISMSMDFNFGASNMDTFINKKYDDKGYGDKGYGSAKSSKAKGYGSAKSSKAKEYGSANSSKPKKSRSTKPKSPNDSKTSTMSYGRGYGYSAMSADYVAQIVDAVL